MSPQLLQHFVRKDSNLDADEEKSDIFSLGITILCCATNASIEQYYDFKVPMIDI